MKNLFTSLFLLVTLIATAQIQMDIEKNAKIGDTLFVRQIALLDNDSSNTTYGYLANARSSTTGKYNTFIGMQSGYHNTLGRSNTYTGAFTGHINQTGSNNTYTGAFAGHNNASSASYNTYIGSYAGFQSTTKNALTHNTFVGNQAGYTARSHGSTFIGSEAGMNHTGGVRCTFVGYQAGKNNGNWNYNTYIGFGAGRMAGDNSFANTYIGCEVAVNSTTGRRNVIIGSQAAQNNNGSQNVFIGRMVGSANATGSNNVIIGRRSTGAAASSNVVLLGANINISNGFFTSNLAQIGDANMALIGGYTTWTNLSDKRFKKNIQNDVPGIDFITKLRPVTYNTDVLKLTQFLSGKNAPVLKEATYLEGAKNKAAITYTGFIAQEVEAAAKEVNYNFSGVIAPKSKKDHYRVSYAEFVVPLVKATQEQQEIIEAQRAKISTLQEDNEFIRQELADLKKLVEQALENKGTAANDLSKTTTKATLNATATLQQNRPNPFNGSTTIDYYLPENVKNAQLRITNIEGKVIKNIPLEGKRTGQIALNRGTLAAGTYYYSLIADGQVVETLKMVLTKAR